MAISTSSLVIPVTLWADRAPTHCISSILLTPDNLVTGCNDGSLCIWSIDDQWQVSSMSKNFLINFKFLSQQGVYNLCTVIDFI